MQKKIALRVATLAALLLAPGLKAQTLDQTIGGCGGVAPTRTIQATPSNYKSLLAGLQPGDRLLLAPGTYTQQLVLSGKNGQPNRCIVIEGPATGTPALFTGSDIYNTISLKNVSYLVFRNLTLDGLGKKGDGVKAEAGSTRAPSKFVEDSMNPGITLERGGSSDSRRVLSGRAEGGLKRIPASDLSATATARP